MSSLNRREFLAGAGAVASSVAIGRGIGDFAGKLFYISKDAKKTAADYILPSAFCILDAIENMGPLEHSNSCNRWYDFATSSAETNTTIGGTYAWDDSSFTPLVAWSGGNIFRFRQDIINGDSRFADGYTHETVVAFDKSPLDSKTSTCRSISLGLSSNSNDPTYIENLRGGTNRIVAKTNDANFYNTAPEADVYANSIHTFSVVATTSSYRVFIDGEQVWSIEGSYTFNPISNKLGNYASLSLGSKFSSIRLYSSALSADDIKRNFAIDKERFGL